MSFVQNLLKKSTTPIHYVWGRNGLGEECYWFVCCSSAKYAELKQTFGTKTNVKLEDYGPIVAKGMGRIPDEETKQMLIKEYKVNWADYEDAMK